MAQTASAGDSEPALAEGKQYIAQRQFKEAVTFFKKLSKEYPKHAEVHFQLGRAYAGLGDLGSAADCFEKAVTLVGDSARYHLAYGQTLLNLAGTGSKLKAFGRAKKGQAEFEKVLQLDPKNQPARLALFQFYLRAPGVVGGDKGKARRLAQELQALVPENLSYRLLDVELLLSEKKFKEAEKLLNTYEDRAGTRRDSLAIGNAYNSLGYYYLEQKNCEQAVACFKQYLAYAPEDANAHDSLGDGHAQCGDLDLAIAEYEKAIKMNPRFEKVSGEKLRKVREKQTKGKWRER